MNAHMDMTHLEHDRRIAEVKKVLCGRGINVAVFTSPENICYLTGLDYEGYFCLHALLVSDKSEVVLIARSIETPTILRQTKKIRFVGYADSADVAALIAEEVIKLAGKSPKLGIQLNSPASAAIAGTLRGSFSDSDTDVSGLVEDLRMIKSSYEIENIKSAAAISDIMIGAGIETAAAGVSEQLIAAEIYRAMISSGGQSPGFPPFIRSAKRIEEPHTVWTSRKLEGGDPVLLELSGCFERYHAPMARCGYVGKIPARAKDLAKISQNAHNTALVALKPGVRASDVFAAWKKYVDEAGALARLQHCGYVVGMSFPPTWTGGPGVVSLSKTNQMEIRVGMAFHLLTWITDKEGNENFLSDCVVVQEERASFMTHASRDLFVV